MQKEQLKEFDQDFVERIEFRVQVNSNISKGVIRLTRYAMAHWEDEKILSMIQTELGSCKFGKVLRIGQVTREINVPEKLRIKWDRIDYMIGSIPCHTFVSKDVDTWDVIDLIPNAVFIKRSNKH